MVPLCIMCKEQAKDTLGVSPVAAAFGFPRTERAATGAGRSAQVAAAEK